MTNYVLLYSGGKMPETEEQQQAVMAAWGAWYGKMGDAVVDGGNPFSPAANTVSKRWQCQQWKRSRGFGLYDHFGRFPRRSHQARQRVSDPHRWRFGSRPRNIRYVTSIVLY